MHFRLRDVPDVLLRQAATRAALLMTALAVAGCTGPSGAEEPRPELTSRTDVATPDAPGGVTPAPTGALSPFLRDRQEMIARLQEAEAQRRLGKYEEATAVYAEVVRGAEGSATGAAALLGLGRVQFLSRRLEAAEESLDRWLTRYPADGRRAEGFFWSARTAAAAGRHERALERYREFIALRPDLEGYARIQMAESLVALRDFGGAVASLEVAEGSVQPGAARRVVQVRLAEVLAAAGDYPAAARRYRDLLAQTTGSAGRAYLQVQLADVLHHSGELDEERRLLVDVVAQAPGTTAAARALQALAQRGDVELTPWLEGVAAFRQRDNDRAEAALRRYLAQEPSGQEAPQAHFYLAILAERRDEDEQALLRYDHLIRDYPAHPLAQDGRWERSRLLETLGRLPEAASGYRDLRLRFPRGQHGEEAAFREGLVAYKQGEYRQAVALWQAVLEDGPSPAAQVRSQFWIGKALLALGDGEAAKRLEAVAGLKPGDYYAVRAAALLQGRSAAQSSAPGTGETRRWGTVPPDEQQEFDRWLAALLPERAQSPEAVRDMVRRDARVVRGLDLLELGLRESAIAELRQALAAFRRDPGALYQLALVFQEQDLHHLAASAGWSLLELSDQSLGGAPRWLQRVVSPAPYAAAVTQETRNRGLDPLLFFALMKQESAFDSGATSGASARGLTQVIPSTGQGIARALGVENWVPDDLYRPALGVQFGAFYLAEQLRRFNGDYQRALAAYNAGPGMAQAWTVRAPDDSDLFVEEISFAETSRYVHRITEYYAQYRALYGEP